MTDKQEKILEAALELFASEGFAATATSKIAKKAGVSEGLIFRHFENKQGLLDALIGQAEERLAQVFGPILFETDPNKVIEKVINIPFNELAKKDFDFWRLQFILKWQKEYNKPDKMKPFLEKLESAFRELGYEDPAFEAQLLNYIIEAISTEILKGGTPPPESFRNFFYRKYKVEVSLPG